MMDLQNDVKPAQKSKKPPKADKKVAPPPQDPLRGDLDPVYIEWYRQNFTAAQFRVKYAKRLALLETK